MELSSAIAAARAVEQGFSSSTNVSGPPGFRSGVRALAPSELDFPEGLLRLPNCPPALFVRGHSAAIPQPTQCVAIIGSRRASSRSLHLARDLARGLAEEGVCVVSGLALGIDAAAHQGTLQGGGQTLAVLASAVDQPTPHRHVALAERILEQRGWLVSERPPCAAVRAWQFPRRNRLVAALSCLVIVVEAGLRSGTMSTVEHALGLGIEVAAVPGPAGSPACAGSNALLRRGAQWIESVEDALRSIGREATVKRVSAPDDPDEVAVLGGLTAREGSVERWMKESGLPREAAGRALSRLVCRGFLRRLPGGRVGRVL
jgi:DNA processing protein